MRAAASGRVWTPPRLQALCSIASRYDCLRVSGLISDAVMWASDPDGLFARWLPNAYTSSRAPRPVRVFPASVQPVRHQTMCSAIVVVVSSISDVYIQFSGSLAARCTHRIVGRLVMHHRPGNSCRFVGQRHGDDVRMLASRQIIQPLAKTVVSMLRMP